LTNVKDYKLRGDEKLPVYFDLFIAEVKLIDEVANHTLDSLQYIKKQLVNNSVEVIDAAYLKKAGYMDNNPFSRSLPT